MVKVNLIRPLANVQGPQILVVDLFAGCFGTGDFGLRFDSLLDLEGCDTIAADDGAGSCESHDEPNGLERSDEPDFGGLHTDCDCLINGFCQGVVCVGSRQLSAGPLPHTRCL